MAESIAKGALWMVGFKLLERSLSLISTLILARILAPKDFGIVAMGMAMIGLIELLSSFGLDTALIQRREATAGHYNSAWTLNLGAGAVVGLLMAALAIPMSQFYREPELVPVVCLLGLAAAMQGLENVGVVDFRKHLRFDLEFRYQMTKKMLGFGATIPLAFILKSYWALILGMLASRVLILVYSYLAHPFRPRLSLHEAGELMHFSKWIVAQNFVTFLRERSADFIVGRIAGASALGTFSLAAQIASMPSTELVAPINRALLPAYSRIGHEPAVLAKQFIAVMGGIAVVALPAVAGVAATAPWAILLVLGPKWWEATLILEIMAFVGVTQVLQTNAYAAFLALGKPDVFVKINAFHVVVLVASLAILVPSLGVIGAAWAFMVAAVVALPVNFAMISKFMGIRVGEFCQAVWRPLVSALVMFGVVRVAGPARPEASMGSADALLPVASCVLLGVLTYFTCLAFLWVASGRPQGAETWFGWQALSKCSGLRARFVALIGRR